MMDDKMRKAYEAWWEKQRNDALPPTDYEIIEWTLNYLRSQQEPVAFAKDGALFWHGAYKHGVSCDLYAAPQPAAAGEEIMVNAAHDVYTLQLQPSGLSSGPRFVVHVPAPEQAVPQGWVLVPKKPTLEMCRAVREETRFCDPVAIYQKMLAAAPPSAPHPAITHCDNCGGDWLDNGLNPVGCPYCKRFTSVPVAAVVREHDGRAFAVLRPAGENLPDGTELYAAQPEQITPKQLARLVADNPDVQFSVKPRPADERDAERLVWRVPVARSPFGERLDHGIRDELVLIMHRGAHGWKVAGQGHALLAHQIYVKNVESLCTTSHEVAVVGLYGGGWRTVWARSDDDVTHPEPPSAPAAIDLWVCAFCRATYRLDALCCDAQREFRTTQLGGCNNE